MVVASVADNKLFLTIDLDVLGDEKLTQLQKQLMMTDNVAEKSSQGMNQLAGQTKDAGDSAEKTGGQFGKMFGIGMNILFLGMALNMVFGRMARNMLKMTGASSALAAGLKSVLLPFFLAITPHVIRLAQSMMDLPRSVKMLIGAFVGAMAVLGPLLMMLGQVALLAISGLSLGMVATAAGVAAGAIAILVAGFKIGAEIGRQFGDEIRVGMRIAGKWVERFVTGASNVLNGLMDILTGVIQFIAGVFTLDLKKALGGVEKVFGGLGKVIKGLLQAAFAQTLAIMEELAPKMFYKGRALIMNLADGIKSVADSIINTIQNTFPPWLIEGLKMGMFGPAGLAAGAISEATSVNDFILGSDGRLIQPDKNDTIVGFNGNGAIQPGQGGGEVTVNINDPVMKEDVDVQRVVDEVEDRVDRNTRGRSGGIS